MGRFPDLVDRIVRKRLTLLWSPECSFLSEAVCALVRSVDERTEVVVDGGIEPPAELLGMARHVIIVSVHENPIAAYHERRLRDRFPAASVVYGAEEERITEVLQSLR